MKVIESIGNYRDSDLLAMTNGKQQLSYRQLWNESDALASRLKVFCGNDDRAVVVFGHKDPRMLVAFLACVKSGRAYVPIDISVPRNRIESIIDTVEPIVILSTEDFSPYQRYPIWDIREAEYRSAGEVGVEITPEDYVKEEDIYYIIFTSGSTGNPKGVQISYSALNHFTEWALTLGACKKEGKKYLNQAPFSFDLSVMDLYMSLTTGSCLVSLEKNVQMDYKRLMETLGTSNVDIWVSTPSFADMCLAEPNFNQAFMSSLRLFLFCGEVLTNRTVENLRNRFPLAQVINTYGPTESTVAVTSVEITEDINNKYVPLPVGCAKPGTEIVIMEGDKALAEGEKGEIVIIGDTVSEGYMRRPEENAKSFFSIEKNGVMHRAYLTGDKGYYQDGMLFYCGRIDFQIKLHGYRMEIEDIEKNLMKVSNVEKAVVIPVSKDGKVKYLQAFCVYSDGDMTSAEAVKTIKEELGKYVPDYMIPRKIKIVSFIPMTSNGKVDRKKIAEEV